MRLTFDYPEVCSAVLRNGLDLEDLSVQLMPADDRLRCVYLRDLPVEVDNGVVSSFLSRYGEVMALLMNLIMLWNNRLPARLL